MTRTAPQLHVGGYARPGRSTWSDEATRDSLLLLAEALRDATGFQVVSIGVVDDTAVCETVAIAGDETARAQLLGTRLPLAVLEQLMTGGTRVGAAALVRRLEPDEDLSRVWWTSHEEPADDEESWHPHDWLAVLAHDDDGAVVGVVQLDLPLDGRRPDEHRLAELDRRCATAARSLVAARERERLSAQARMARTARDVVRRSAGRQTIPSILARSHTAVMEGFRARGLFIQLLGEQGVARVGTVYRADGEETSIPQPVVDIAERAARTAWSAQQVSVVDRCHPRGDWLGDTEALTLQEYLGQQQIGSLLFVPIGVGRTCLGSLALTRSPGDPTWSDVERSTALDVGHDLGHAILNARAHRRERELLTELRELDAYKSGLIATVSHELRNPLSAVAGHLEILRSMRDAMPDGTDRSLAAMERGTSRLERIIEDLLTFSKVGDPGRVFAPAVIDLREVVRDVRELHDLPARRRRQRVEVELPDSPVLVRGLTGDLDTVVSNLVGNALKYSGEGTVVRLVLTQDAREVALTCTDQGLGISPADQRAVFGEFFRSADPAVRRQGGTGLGLAIVGRIVKRHRGRVTVTSEIGVGSTFRVVLPSVEEFERAAAEAALEADLVAQVRGAHLDLPEDGRDDDRDDDGPARAPLTGSGT